MTYYVKVEVTKEFDSEKAAEEFAAQVIKPIKGVDYTKTIRHYEPKSYSSSIKPSKEFPYTMIFNVYNPTPEDVATSIQKRVTRLEQMGTTNG